MCEKLCVYDAVEARTVCFVRLGIGRDVFRFWVAVFHGHASARGKGECADTFPVKELRAAYRAFVALGTVLCGEPDEAAVVHPVSARRKGKKCCVDGVLAAQVAFGHIDGRVPRVVADCADCL